MPEHRSPSLALAVLLAALGASVAVPSAVRAAEQPPSAPSPASAPAAAPVTVPLEKLTFQQVIERALLRNSTVQVAVAEVLRAEGLLLQARANALPHVTGNAAYTRLDSAREFAGQVFTPQGVKTANVTVAAPLLDLAQWAQWAHAEDNQKIARLSTEQVKRNVAIAAANAYLAVIARHRTLEVNQLALTNARSHFDVSHQRQVGGIASRLEEVQASQEASNDEVLVEQATIALRRAQEALAVLIAADAPVDAADEPSFEKLGTAEEALTDLNARRSDLQTLVLRQDAAERVFRDSWRDWVPTLGLTFQELYQNPATLVQPEHSWQAVLNLSVPIFDAGLRRGQKTEREALYQQAQANLSGAVVQARSDVRTATEAIRLADEGLASARNASRQAHDALDISNLSYSAGASTSLDVLDSERRARDADNAAAVAEDAARQARLDLLVASGRFPPPAAPAPKP
ncbi:MAG TPA: TolC family protein [Thermoanaerobaculia bacterium]